MKTMRSWIAAGCVLVACQLAPMSVMPAQAAPIEQLRCIDDRLNERQRADIAGLFAQQPDDPAGAVKTAQGSAAASRDMTLALASCTARFGWSRAAQDAASRYLVEIARLARIAVDHGAAWSVAMERYAPLAAKRLPDGKDVEEHLRAQIVAGAIANGSGAIRAEQRDAVIAYLHGWRDVDRAREAFAGVK